MDQELGSLRANVKGDHFLPENPEPLRDAKGLEFVMHLLSSQLEGLSGCHDF